MDRVEINERNARLRTHILSLSKTENWTRSLNMTDESLKLFENEPWLSEVETVYVVGHGTSYATSLNAESWFAHIAGLRAQAVPAYQFCHYADDYLLHPEKTLVIGISCGGKTASVVRSLEIAKDSGAITLCLSGIDDSTCTKMARYRIITDAHIEKKVKVSAYTISHIFLLMGAYRLAVLLGSKNGSLNSDQVAYWGKQLEQVISIMKYLPDLFERMNKISEDILKIGGNNFVVLGTGPNIGTMKEGALKISELGWMFGAGEELEDFAHGRFREVDSKTPLFIISPAGKPYEKTMDLLAGCSISKTPTVIFTDQRTTAMEKLATYILDMPKIQDEYLTPFVYVFPLWFYGFYIRQSAGELAGEVRHNLFAVDINFKANFNESGEGV